MYQTLIPVGALASHHSFVIVDCRHSLSDPEAGSRDYHQGHIPGASFFHIDRDLSGAMTGSNGRHPLPDRQMLAAKLGAIGAGPSTQIVAYDQNNGMWAARLWWLVRWLGHESVAVLDGGMDAWIKGGYAPSSLPATPTPAHFDIRPSLEGTVDADSVLTSLADPAATVIDARSADRFRGKNETIDRVAGHIPGAVNRPYTWNLAPDGGFKPSSELREEFRALLGRKPANRVIHQCGSGVTACHNILAMRVAGLSGSKLYPGSWSEWIADPKRPVALDN